MAAKGKTRGGPPCRLSALLTRLVYVAEDLFERLPVRWTWWPALGLVEPPSSVFPATRAASDADSG